MTVTAKDALDQFLKQPLLDFNAIPDAVGLYGLGDHEGKIHYFGMTYSHNFKDRILHRHITGSERNSHKLACNYSVGRLWHDPKHPKANQQDGKIARAVRQAFIRKHCGFVCLPLSICANELKTLEREVIDLAWPEIADWNKTRRRVATFDEPRGLVDDIILELGLDDGQIAALERQDAIYRSLPADR